MFKVGDRVRIVYPGSAYDGLAGTVVDRIHYVDFGCYVELDKPTNASKVMWCQYLYLELLEPVKRIIVPLPLP